MAENVIPQRGHLMFGKPVSGAPYVVLATDDNGKLLQAPSDVLTPIAGYEQKGCAAATALVVPVGATVAVISIEGAAVRWRDDGTNPTAAVGMPLGIGASMTYTGNLAAIKFIQQAATATLNISYYK